MDHETCENPAGCVSKKVSFNRSPARAMQKSSSEAKMICCYPPSQHVPPNIGIDQYPSCCTGLWDGFQMIYGDCRVWERNNLTENRLALWFITIFPHQNVHLGMSSPFSDTRIILSWLQLTVGYMCVYIYIYIHIDSKNSLFNPRKKCCC